MPDKSEQRTWYEIEENLGKAMEHCQSIATASGDAATTRVNEQIYKHLSQVRSNLEDLKKYHPVAV